MADAVPGTGEHRAAVEASGSKLEALLEATAKELANYERLTVDDEAYTRRNQTTESAKVHVERVPRLVERLAALSGAAPRALSNVERVMKQAYLDHVNQPSALPNNNAGQARRRLKDGSVSISGDIDWSKLREMAAQESRAGRLDQTDPDAMAAWIRKQMTTPVVEAVQNPPLHLVSNS